MSLSESVCTLFYDLCKIQREDTGGEKIRRRYGEDTKLYLISLK